MKRSTSKKILIISASILGVLIILVALPWIIDPEGSKAIVKRNNEEKEYFKNLTQDAEIIVNFTNSKDKDVELYWSLIKGEVDNYKTNHNVLGYGPRGIWDCRLIKLTEVESSGFIFESSKNTSSIIKNGEFAKGEDYYYEVEIKFDLPEDLSQKEHNVNGTIYITGHNASGDGGDISESYDAKFKVYNYSVDKTTPKRETVTVNPDDVVNEMKNILDEEASEEEQPKGEELEDGKYCFQFDDLVNSGTFYYADVTIQNSAVLGNLIVEYESGDGYSATFIGTIEGNKLNIKVSYDNDGGGPYAEKWKINQSNLTLEQPEIILTNINCN